MSVFAWWMKRRSLPRPVARPDGYAIEGEVWCEYVPAEPMTASAADEVAAWARRVREDPARWEAAARGMQNDLRRGLGA